MKPVDAVLGFFVALAAAVTVVFVVRTVEQGWSWEPFFIGIISGSLFQTGVLVLVSVFRGRWR